MPAKRSWLRPQGSPPDGAEGGLPAEQACICLNYPSSSCNSPNANLQLTRHPQRTAFIELFTTKKFKTTVDSGGVVGGTLGKYS